MPQSQKEKLVGMIESALAWNLGERYTHEKRYAKITNGRAIIFSNALATAILEEFVEREKIALEKHEWIVKNEIIESDLESELNAFALQGYNIYSIKEISYLKFRIIANKIIQYVRPSPPGIIKEQKGAKDA